MVLIVWSFIIIIHSSSLHVWEENSTANMWGERLYLRRDTTKKLWVLNPFKRKKAFAFEVKGVFSGVG